MAETLTALALMSMAAAMVLTFNLAASRVHRQAQLRAGAAALLDVHGAAARRIDCVRNAGLVDACGPEPNHPQTTPYMVSRPAGDNVAAGESGHPLVDLEWTDYYRPEDAVGCTSDGAAPRSVREITASWSSGGRDFSETRLVLGPRVPLTRAWTAKAGTGPGRVDLEYEPTGEALPVPWYGRGVDTSGNRVWCKVLVAAPGEVRDTNSIVSPTPVCILAEGWNDPAGRAGGCL